MRKRLSTRARAALFIACDGVCHVCGLKIQACEAWDFDHVIPLALGGADDESNLAPAHKKTCHSEKTAKQDVPAIARAIRREAHHKGFKAKSRAVIPGSKRSPWKRHINGAISRRNP